MPLPCRGGRGGNCPLARRLSSARASTPVMSSLMNQNLPVPDSMAYQHAQWRFERVMWLVLGALVSAALLGLVGGPGPLNARTHAQAGVPVRITCRRYLRCQTASSARVEFESAAVRNGEARLWFDAAYLRRFDIREIVPPPQRCETEDGGLGLIFAADAAAPPSVALVLVPQLPGPSNGRIGVGPDAAFALSQFVYP